MNHSHANQWDRADRALAYLARADSLPHRTEGEAVLLDHLPPSFERVLDLGTGDGRLLALIKIQRPQVRGTALDFSPPMLEAVRSRFKDDPSIEVVAHNLEEPLPHLGQFQAIVSSFAIHHLPHERKRSLYAEIYQHLEPGGIFCNLEHVASPTQRLHEHFLRSMGIEPDSEDPSNQLLDVETQLQWLRDIGFDDVDCYWKWLEMALLVGVKPERFTIG